AFLRCLRRGRLRRRRGARCHRLRRRRRGRRLIGVVGRVGGGLAGPAAVARGDHGGAGVHPDGFAPLGRGLPPRPRHPAPAPGGPGVSTLSVEISTIVSSASMWSPTCFVQRVIVPSETLTPIWGITTSTTVPVAMGAAPRLVRSIGGEALDARQHVLGLGQE